MEPPQNPAGGPPASESSGRVRNLYVIEMLLGAGLLGAALVIALAVRWGLRKGVPPVQADPFALTPLSASPYLNTDPGVGYVGSEACRACHEDRHASFRTTGMGRSMAAVNLSREPPDAVFEHPLSKRRYQICRKDGQLWHREFLLTEGPQEVLLAEYPLKYVVGSGRHSLMPA